MKLSNKISLRMRITLLTGGILIVCSVLLSLASLYNSFTLFLKLTSSLANMQIQIDSSAKESEVLQEARKNVLFAKQEFDKFNFTVLTAVSIFGMSMVYIVARRSLRPIHKLSETILNITEDNLQYRISDTERSDEVGVLGRSFNMMLDRLERSFSREKRFSSNVAHELKTPLATITAGIQVLYLDENPSLSDYQETLMITERNVKRLLNIVDDLLRLGDEKKMFYFEPVVLRELFDSIFTELKPQLEEKKIEIKIICKLETICAIQGLLYRAFFNLVENAIKYNTYGGKIVITAESEKGLGLIKIADTGSGIPSSELSHIFEPFYRVNKSRSRRTGGAGLGLSIVSTIVEKHGWRIKVDSTMSKGSTFTIIIPKHYID
ncbi:hypothetical protein GCM10023310_44580 [Paenibacillus vulneris]|uniref:histidine kinase n=1 Tax=Paenibacillus vulneris TaxID=1133364 RepID=A0ABW3UV46_9BACL